MSTWLIAVILRPLAGLLLFAMIVIPIELALRRLWPEGRVKQLLFGRNFDKRHPRVWLLLCVCMYPAIAAFAWVLMELRELF